MECETLEYYDTDGNPVYKKKKKFDTLDEAIEAARITNLQEKTISKVVAYKCTKCFKYHVGRNGKKLTDKKREKIKNAIDKQNVK